MKYKLLAVITSFVLFLSCACVSKQGEERPLPEETLYQMQRAFNLCNAEGIAECFEQDIQDLYQTGVKAATVFLFFGRKQILQLINALLKYSLAVKMVSIT